MIYFPQGFHQCQSVQITITMLLEHSEIVSEVNLGYLVCALIDIYSLYLIHIPAVPPPNGHLVNVTHTYTSTDSITGSSRNAKPAAPKKKSMTMLGNIALEGVTRVDFIKAFLSIHNLHTQFAPGIYSGPPFKLFYVRNFVFTIIHILIKFCSGGKGNAPTFLMDKSFSLALMAIVKKDKKKIQVTVKFNTDMMSGY